MLSPQLYQVCQKYLKKQTELEAVRLEQRGLYLEMENNKYKEQLTLYLNDCKTISEKLSNLTYTKPSLIKLFKYYYNYTSKAPIFQKENEKVKLEKGFITGISQKSIEFSGVGYEYLTKADFTKSKNLTAGIYLDLIFPRNQRKWSIYNELLYSSFKINGNYEDFNREEDYTITTTNFNYSYLSMNTLVRYKHPIRKTYIFINFGMSNGYALKEYEHKTEEIVFYTSTRTEEGSALEKYSQKYEHGYILGAGVKLGHLSAEIRYWNGSGMADKGIKSHVDTYCLLIGFGF